MSYDIHEVVQPSCQFRFDSEDTDVEDIKRNFARSRFHRLTIFRTFWTHLKYSFKT